jgi:hypothetical protein
MSHKFQRFSLGSRIALVLLSVAALVWITSSISPRYDETFLQENQLYVNARAKAGLELRETPRVLFVVNTYEGNYASRVGSIRETYLKRIKEKQENADLIFIGGKTGDGNADLLTSTCVTGYREDSCKRADMFTLTYDYLKRPGKEIFDWVFFFDDDAYVLPDNFQRMLLNAHNADQNLTAVWAIAGCAHVDCGGICGGGGYYMTRDTLFQIVEGVDHANYPDLRAEADVFDVICGRCGDLAIARVIEDIHHIPVLAYPLMNGTYVWDLPNPDGGFEYTLGLSDPLPWLYHYPAKNKFYEMQAVVERINANREID